MVGHSFNPICSFGESNQMIADGDQIRETKSGEEVPHPFRHGTTNLQTGTMDEMILNDSYLRYSEAALSFEMKIVRVR
jgi:hypothetical protein